MKCVRICEKMPCILSTGQERLRKAKSYLALTYNDDDRIDRGTQDERSIHLCGRERLFRKEVDNDAITGKGQARRHCAGLRCNGLIRGQIAPWHLSELNRTRTRQRLNGTLSLQGALFSCGLGKGLQALLRPRGALCSECRQLRRLNPGNLGLGARPLLFLIQSTRSGSIGNSLCSFAGNRHSGIRRWVDRAQAR